MRLPLVLLLLVGCAKSHRVDFDEPIVEPGPVSKFILAQNESGEEFMLRLDPAAASLEVVGERLDFLTGTRTFRENAAADRAVINADGRAYAYRDGVWVPLCPTIGATRCYAGETAGLGHLTISPWYDEGLPDHYTSYGGRHIGEFENGRVGIGTDRWLFWGTFGAWSMAIDGESRPFPLAEPQFAVHAFDDHLMAMDRDTRQLWLWSVSDAEPTELLCAGGEVPVGFPRAFRQDTFVGCSGSLERVRGGRLEPTGVQFDMEEPHSRTPILVANGQSSLSLQRYAVQLRDPRGSMIAEYARTPGEFEPPDGSMGRMEARVLGAVEHERGVVALASFQWFIVAHDDISIRHEIILVLLGLDGSISSVPISESVEDGAPFVWLPKSAERAFWVDEGRLMMRDYYLETERDISDGWTF